MLEWKSKGKPWGVGEMGMCYAGTPAHVSVVNGDRAFESQEGRMEGLAGEAFETISMQRGLDACYASISTSRGTAYSRSKSDSTTSPVP